MLWCSAHEVHIDDAQLAWFEEQLQEAGARPVAVFTHAPVMGSGLKAVLDVRTPHARLCCCVCTNLQSELSLLSRREHPSQCCIVHSPTDWNNLMWLSFPWHTLLD